MADSGEAGSPAAIAAGWRRMIELPRYLRTVTGHSELIATLSELARELGVSRACVVSGPSVTLALGEQIARGLEIAAGPPVCTSDNSQAEVEALAAAIESRAADVAVAAGGGRTIDVAKSACELLGLPVVIVPTQLTADGIASPVSVIRAHSGEVESRRARLPAGVVADLDVLRMSPVESTRAGLGDLLANGCAVRDWRRAAGAGLEAVDDFAALLAEAATDLAFASDVGALAGETLDAVFLRRLLHGLVLSGLAMEIAGSSRPCSGSEHLVSHAIDRLFPGVARHGEQVAFGTMLCLHLHGEDWRAVKRLLRRAGMERAASGFGLGEQAIVQAIKAAPGTRPGRFTVLDETELTDRALRPVVAEVLGD